MQKIKNLVLEIRPLHWIKNLSLFGALIFSGLANIEFYRDIAFLAFVAFCFASSATYVFNDIIDRSKDQNHPIKKFRPMAAGLVTVPEGLLIIFFTSSMSLAVANSINHLFTVLIVIYLVLQFFYSLILKKIPILDILIIASGFVIRVYAGAIAVNAHLSVWFLLCVVSVALFLAAGKRRSELNTALKFATRNSLERYSKELLDSYVTMFGSASWMSWALYTFFESPKASMPLWLTLAEISKTTTVNKLLMITIPLSIFAIMRYQSLIFQEKGEAPEKILLRDIPLLSSVFLWGTIVIFILYGGLSFR
ncbi:hypothetical protein A2188_00920 [Candidatus Woesebacteria bacterium RIFOXYA1_FULL_43_9]|uniref:Decaprenyl-phosphate phosphoribosyltransferase n=1 Tax=Candidatus Woesebacteria bacterium RIFOXYA1_FULL_43_9 TaxID=1802534 RepID=A0A1F8CQ37_9BACT|nr:MAG: hypothetical protein A2188_00920 [Candidatus Woesebacteria bacterium RIFOXYA1_FULL_43_9]